MSDNSIAGEIEPLINSNIQKLQSILDTEKWNKLDRDQRYRLGLILSDHYSEIQNIIIRLLNGCCDPNYKTGENAVPLLRHISPLDQHNLACHLLDTYEGVQDNVFLNFCEICHYKEFEIYVQDDRNRAYEECAQCEKCICSHCDPNMDAWIEDNDSKLYVCHNCKNKA